MPSFAELERAANTFLESFQGESFDFAEALEAVLKLHPAANAEEEESVGRKLRNLLDSEETLARTFHGERYYVLDRFLHGLVFRCKPRPFELEKGILVPGARFEAFHPEELFVDDLEISSCAGRIGRKDETCPYDRVSDLYFLLGPAGTLDMFYAESQENADAIADAGGLQPALPLTQSVFDFSEFYRQTDFRSGDVLKFTLDSYLNGTMKVEREARPDAPSRRDEEHWLEVFEDALIPVCREYKDSFEIPMQILYAYLYAKESGTDLRKLPSPPMDVLHTMLKTVSFRRNGMEWTLAALDGEDGEEEEGGTFPPVPPEGETETGSDGHVHHGHAPGEACSCGCGHGNSPDVPEDLRPEDFSASAGSLDSLGAILKETKSPVGEIELRALMLDSIAEGVETFEEFLRVNGGVLPSAFADDAQEAAFQNFAEDLWEFIFTNYSHNHDAEKAPLRQRLLEIAEKERGARSSLVGANRADGKLEKLEEIRRSIVETLAVLNSEEELPGEEAREDLELRIGDIEDSLEEFLD